MGLAKREQLLEMEMKANFGYDFCSTTISRSEEAFVVQSTELQQAGRDAPLWNMTVQIQSRVEFMSFLNGKADSSRAQTERACPSQF